MNLNYFNLCHLLELGFRFPEVGAVNFNIIYLILKTIIKKQRLETLKPADVIKSKQSSSEGLVTFLQEMEAGNDENGFMPVLKKRKNVENEISDVNEKIELLMERISDLEEKFSSLDGKKQMEDTEALKHTDENLGKFYTDIKMLKNEYDKLGLNAEELNKMVTKTMNIVDEVETLKEQVDKLDMYIYCERYEPTEDFNAPRTDVVTPVVELKPEVKKQYKFADVVRELMSLPKESKIELIDRSAEEQDDADEVKPATRKAYEKFLDIAKKVKSGKKEDNKPEEEAKTIAVAQLQEEAILPATDFTSTEVKDPSFRCQPKKKFKTLVHAITLAKYMQKPKNVNISEDIPSATPLSEVPGKDKIVPKLQSKVKSEDSMETASLDPASSSEHGIAHPQRSSLLLDDGSSAVRSTLLDPVLCSEHGIMHRQRSYQLSEDGSSELKRWFVIYLRKQLDGMEATFLNKIKMVEHIQQETRNIREQMQGIIDRLAAEEISHTETKETISIIEKMAQELESGIQNVKIKLGHKPNANNVNISITKKDFGVLEDRVYEINEITRKDISAFKNLINNTLKQFQANLDDKTSNFEVNIQLEPLASRLKRLEKMLKEICLKMHMLEFEHIGPIDIKQYVHCIDGTRVKPIQRLPIHCISETQSVLSMESAQSLLDEDVPQKILTSVQKRLEEASIRDSKQYMERRHTKPPIVKH